MKAIKKTVAGFSSATLFILVLANATPANSQLINGLDSWSPNQPDYETLGTEKINPKYTSSFGLKSHPGFEFLINRPFAPISQ